MKEKCEKSHFQLKRMRCTNIRHVNVPVYVLTCVVVTSSLSAARDSTKGYDFPFVIFKVKDIFHESEGNVSRRIGGWGDLRKVLLNQDFDKISLHL